MHNSNLIQNFPAHLIHGGGLDVCFEIQYPKQTSSQLMAFLRRNGKREFITHLSIVICEIFSNEWVHKSRKPPLQIGLNLKPTTKMETTMPVACPLRKELGVQLPEVQEPVFKLKCVAGDGQVYSCVIVSSTDLWDLTNVFIGDVTHALPQTVYSELGNSCLPLPSQESSSPVHRSSLQDRAHLSEDEEERLLKNKKHVESDGVNIEEENGDGENNRKDKTVEKNVRRSLLIPPFKFHKFTELSVIVTHVVDPGHFYIQHKDSKQKDLDSVMDLNAGIVNLPSLSQIPDIGSYAVGWFPEHQRWCRIQVTKICGVSQDAGICTTGGGGLDCIEMEVQRVDFGDFACLPLKDLREISVEIAAYPAQALQVTLAHVSPLFGSGWSNLAVSWFKDMVKDRSLYARLYPQETSCVMVELFMERGRIGAMRRGVPVSMRLAQNGHASHTQLKTVGLKRSPAQEYSRKMAAAWEKYLISHYAQTKKCELPH